MRFLTKRILFAPGGSFVCSRSDQVRVSTKLGGHTVGLERDIREGKSLRRGHEMWDDVRSLARRSPRSALPTVSAFGGRRTLNQNYQSNRPLEDDNRYKVVNFWTFVPFSPDPPVPKANTLSHTSRINPQRRPWLPALQSLLGYLYEASNHELG